jgi:hypothetical protein
MLVELSAPLRRADGRPQRSLGRGIGPSAVKESQKLFSFQMRKSRVINESLEVLLLNNEDIGNVSENSKLLLNKIPAQTLRKVFVLSQISH